jgi:hypothetical protein
MTKTITASKTTIDFENVQAGVEATCTSTISASGTEGVKIDKLDLTGSTDFTATAEGIVYPAVAYVDGTDYYLNSSGTIQATDDGTGIFIGVGNASGGIDLDIKAAGILSSLPTSWDYGTVSAPTDKTFTLSVDSPDSQPATITGITYDNAQFTDSESFPVYVPSKMDVLSGTVPPSYSGANGRWENNNTSSSYFASATDVSLSEFKSETSFIWGLSTDVYHPVFVRNLTDNSFVLVRIKSGGAIELNKRVSGTDTLYTSTTTISVGTRYYCKLIVLADGTANVYLDSTDGTTLIADISGNNVLDAINRGLDSASYDIPQLGSVYSQKHTDTATGETISEIAWNGEYTYDTANPTTDIATTYFPAMGDGTGNLNLAYTYDAGAESGTLAIPLSGVNGGTETATELTNYGVTWDEATTSWLFDKVDRDRMSYPLSSDFDFGTGDFDIEFVVAFDQASWVFSGSQYILANGQSGATLYIESTYDRLYFTQGVSLYGTPVWNAGEFNTYKVGRVSGSCYMTQNGVDCLDYTSAETASVAFTLDLFLSTLNYPLDGKIKSFKIWKAGTLVFALGRNESGNPVNMVK